MMLSKRIISAIVGIPLLLGVAYIGGKVLIIFLMLLGAVGVYEFYGMMKEKGLVPAYLLGYIVFVFIILTPFYANSVELILALLFFIGILYTIIGYPRITVDDIVLTSFFASYVGFMLSFAVRMAVMKNAFFIFLLVFLFTWSSDVGGYIIGKTIGIHKMAPTVSPNKSWEGAAGGFILTLIIAIVLYNFNIVNISNLYYMIVLGGAASLAAQVGDLFMSAAKRFLGVKDAGRLIPGHGGVLDRFDSFMLVLPVVYLLYMHF